MANYPKITGNSSAAKLDRPTGLDKTNFFEVKLSDSTTAKEYIYGVVIIEGGGDDDTEVAVSDIKIKNASGVSMTTFETTGATFRSNAAIQDALFCLSPLKKVGATSWNADKPFMGVVKANNTSYEQIKTADWAVAAGDAGLPQGYYDAVGAGPLAYIKVNEISGSEINGILDATTDFSDAEYIVPIYNHAYITTHPIPSGEYAAILIKCDLTAGLFEGQAQNTLEITHNAIVESTNSNANYSIRLDVNGSNIFVFGSSFVGSNFTQADSEVSSTLFRTMKHINQDLHTGTSWHAKDATNPLSGVTYDAETDSLYSGLEVAASGSSVFTGILATFYDDEDILTAWGANGSMFSEAELTVFDASSMTDDFLFSVVAGSGDMNFFTQSSATLPTTENKTTVLQNNSESLIFKHSKIGNSTLYSTGTVRRQTEIKGSDGSTYSFYPNFSVDSIKSTRDLQIIAEQNGTFTKTLSVNYCVYPQFTYGTTALEIFDVINNFTLNSGKPNKQKIAHASDEFIKLETPNSKYCPIAPNNGFYGDVDGVANVPLTVKHNVRVNVLSDDDVLSQHAINAPGGYYKGDGSVKVFLAPSENVVKDDTSGAETSDVPTVGEQKLDYTVEVSNSNYVVNKDVGFTDFLPRDADGSYTNMNKDGGYYVNSEEFRAPITNWQPGYRHGQTWGTQRIPYYHNIYATGKLYKQQSAFFAARPLFHIEHKQELSDIVDNFIDETSVYYVDRLEFVGVPGLTPTVANNENGLKDFGTNSYRETSKKFTCSSSANTDRITNFATGLGSKTDSQIPGAEVFGLDSFFGEGRHFIGSSGFTADSGSTPGFTKLVKEDGTPAVCILTSNADNITCTFGKPTHPATVKRTNFAFTGGVATSDLRSRVFRPYGFDLTCNINTDIENVRPFDTFIPTSVVGDGSLAAGTHPSGTTEVGKRYIANNAGNSYAGSATVDVLDLDPKELGITYNGSTEIKSARFNTNNLHAEIGGTGIPVYYSTLGTDDLQSGVYKSFMEFNLWNIGLEDVLLKSVNFFDPLYLPVDNFTVKPPAASDPVWSFYEAVASSSSTSASDNKSFKNTDLNPSNLLLSQDALLYKLGRRSLDNTDLTLAGQTRIVTQFQVNASNAAGTYFQGLEFEYYRDEGITQHSHINNDYSVKPLADRRVWKTRVLLQITVDQRSTIDIQDVDGTSVNTNGILVFGTIQA
mgnify:FL=1